jgi:puromycin-sensitive aminopeptidase
MPHPADDRTFRLPLHLRPHRYEATLSVDLDGKRFSGTERIQLGVAEPSEEIVLHAAELDVTRATLHAGGRVLEAASITPSVASETVILRFGEPVPRGQGTHELAWTGRMIAGLRGLYHAKTGIAATQFEAADARRVFPSFDEPGFKATWRLAVEAPAGAVVLSNGAPEGEEALGGGRKRVAFAETPPLPTYLVALVVGPIEGFPPVSVRGVPVRTWASPEKLPLTGFGQDVAVEVLPRLEDYFGVPYAFGKVDQVGLPEFEAGAMENAGLVTYREVALLLDPQTASLAQKKRVAEVVTHELAHQWFGNWVTMTWWDDLWLNEAFATWIAFKIVDQWNPAWRVWLEFEQGKAAAMHLDALRSTHPVRAEIRNVAEAGEAFDLITYEKGGAVLRMIEGYLGAERFRDGIRLYMRRHAKGNAVADDLGRRSRRPPASRCSSSRTPGSAGPGSRSCGSSGRAGSSRSSSGASSRRRAEGRTTRSGRCLSSSGTGTVSAWSRSGSSCERGAPRWSSPARATPGSCVRTPARPASTASRTTPPGSRRSGGISRGSRRGANPARLDEWALVQEASGDRRVPRPRDALRRRGDHAVLDELVARLSAIEHRLHVDGDRLRFAALVATLFGPRLAETGWDPTPGEPDAVRLRRTAAVRALGLVARSAGVVHEATARLDRWTDGDRAALEPNLHDPAVAMAARSGDGPGSSASGRCSRRRPIRVPPPLRSRSPRSRSRSSPRAGSSFFTDEVRCRTSRRSSRRCSRTAPRAGRSARLRATGSGCTVG